MTQSRSSLISLSDTPFYHCISRCVRQAYLCGVNGDSGRDFEHRRQWMVDRIRQLSNIFAIDVCAYSIMSNHYHLVLHANETEVASCSDEEVCKRWYQLYSGSVIVSRWRKGELTTEAEVQMALTVITGWRDRLLDISWFMRCLNEFIARKANKEDGCKGRFWEGRFKSQALLDEKAVLTCMAYVDLNPIRAKMADSVAQSEYTSLFERIHGVCARGDKENHADRCNSKPLFAFMGDNEQPQCLGYLFHDYLELVDWSGRVIRDEKRGSINEKTPSLVSSLGLFPDEWLDLARRFGKDYHGAVGSLEELMLFAQHTDKKWIAGQRKLERLFH